MKLKKKITIKDYIVAKKKIINIAYKYNFLSIYEYGSYKNPGLSDIDIIIVLRKKKSKINYSYFLNEIRKKNLEFFIGFSTIMFVEKEIFENILVFDDLKLNKIYGKKIKFKKFSNLNKLLLELSIIEWLPERLLKLKINLNKLKKINIRQHLGLMNSYKYTLKKILEYYKYENTKDIEYIVKKIDSLRLGSQKIINFSKVKSLTKEVILSGFKILTNLSHDIDFEIDKKLNISESILSFPNRSKIYFKDQSDLFKNNLNGNYIYVPKLFSFYLFFYLNKKNSLSSILKKWFKSKKYELIIKNNKIKYILNLRSKLVSKNILLLKKHNLKKGLYKFGWFYE